jgi:acetyl esterase/lipase
MKFERIPLENEGTYLDAYVSDPIKGFRRRPILVIPGGAYATVCSDREGEPIALAFLARGFAPFVLHYSVGGVRPYPAQLREVAQAMEVIASRTESDALLEGTFVVGFSAGGHLAATAGTMWHRSEVAEGFLPEVNRPLGVMLIYPVVSFRYGNGRSLENLLCKKTPTEEEMRYVSADLAVDERSAPAFLLHTAEDALVDVENSLDMARAYKRAGVPFELHVYPHGPHGVALANEVTWVGNPAYLRPEMEGWVDMATVWAKNVAKCASAPASAQ